MESSVKGFWGMFGLFPKQWRGDFDKVISHLDKWHDHIQAIPSPTFRAGELWGRGLALGGSGEYQRAIDILHELRDYAQRSGEVFMWLRSMNTLGWTYAEILNTSGLCSGTSKSRGGASC